MKLILRFKDGTTVEVKVETSSSPVTVSKLIAAAPLSSSVIRAGPEAIIPLDLGVGPETFRTFARRGEVIYIPKSKQLIIAISNVDLGDRVNPIGFLLGDPEKLRPGPITIQKGE